MPDLRRCISIANQASHGPLHCKRSLPLPNAIALLPVHRPRHELQVEELLIQFREAAARQDVIHLDDIAGKRALVIVGPFPFRGLAMPSAVRHPSRSEIGGEVAPLGSFGP